MSKGRERRTKPAPGTPFFVTMQGPGRPIRRDAHRLLWPAICFLTVVLKHLPARSESMVSAGATASGDNQRFRWQEAQANWTHEGEQSGERLVVDEHARPPDARPGEHHVGMREPRRDEPGEQTPT